MAGGSSPAIFHLFSIIQCFIAILLNIIRRHSSIRRQIVKPRHHSAAFLSSNISTIVFSVPTIPGAAMSPIFLMVSSGVLPMML